MEQRQNSFIRKKRIASKRLFLGVAKFDYYYYSRRIDDKRHSRSMRRSNWSMRDWMAANGNWKLWFLHGAPRLILPPRLSQKRRGGDGRNGIAVKSSFLPKRRAYRSLGVTTNRDPSARSLSLSLPFFSYPFSTSVKRTIGYSPSDPPVLESPLRSPAFLEPRQSVRVARLDLRSFCRAWYLLIARNRFALLISSNEISTALVYLEFNRKIFLETFPLKNRMSVREHFLDTLLIQRLIRRH